MAQRDEQTLAVILGYINLDKEEQRRPYLSQHLDHPPSLDMWAIMETTRTEIRAMETGMTSGEIAKLTGIGRATTRRMSERGEMPAPVSIVAR